MAKQLAQLYWVEDLLPKGVRKKPMFGGFAYYLNEKLILVMFEDDQTKSYKGKSSPFAIWNGCMFPVEKEFHREVLEEFSFLVNHAVLPKWLYLPIETEGFESNVEIAMRQLRKQDPRFGTIPAKKGKGRLVKEKKSSNEPLKIDLRVDTRKPKMFSDEPAEQVLSRAQKISDLKNLGPTTEEIFKKAGITSAKQFIKLGWKKTIEILVKNNPRHAHSMFTYAIIGALKNQEFSKISEIDKVEAQSLTKKLREKYRKIKTKKKIKAKFKTKLTR